MDILYEGNISGIFLDSPFQKYVEQLLSGIDTHGKSVHVSIRPISTNPDVVTQLCLDEDGKTHRGSPEYGKYIISRTAYETYDYKIVSRHVTDAIATIQAFVREVEASLSNGPGCLS